MNHGYAKQCVENSEFTKRREELEQKLANVRRWGAKAHERSEKASDLANRRWHEAKQHREELYEQLIAYEGKLAQQGLDNYQIKQNIAVRKADFDEQLDELWYAHHRSKRKTNKEWRKAERYAYRERELLRELEDLNTKARQMYELDDRKDHVMTTLRVALTNLVMWVRDHLFPEDYDNATWKRLAPFFRLPGYIATTDERCTVYLRRFNDAPLNRDLEKLCTRVSASQLQLPDGRVLRFQMSKEDVQIPDISIAAVD